MAIAVVHAPPRCSPVLADPELVLAILRPTGDRGKLAVRGAGEPRSCPMRIGINGRPKEALARPRSYQDISKGGNVRDAASVILWVTQGFGS
jgi:hypothetical protein